MSILYNCNRLIQMLAYLIGTSTFTNNLIIVPLLT